MLMKLQLDRSQLLEALRQLTVTLQEVHATGLTHSDIKGDNICVDVSQGMVRVTLIDLGLAARPGRVLEFDPNLSGHIAPEVATTGTSALADIYAVGILIQDIENFDVYMHWSMRFWANNACNDVASHRPSLGDLL